MIAGLPPAGPAWAADLTEQAEVTQWPARLALVLVVLAVIGLAVWGMWRGWAARGRRQADIPGPPQPRPLIEVWEGPVPGSYLATTSAGDWLDRVVVHGLGVRSAAELTIGQAGVLLEREGAPDLFVPAEDIVAVRLDKGIAGFVYERGGVVVVTWQLGERLLDTGFRAARTDEHVRVVDVLSRLAPITNTLPTTNTLPQGTSAPRPTDERGAP